MARSGEERLPAEPKTVLYIDSVDLASVEPLAKITAATVAVLEALLEDDAHRWGLEIIKRTGKPSGTVYPILDRLERHGWVGSEWENDSERRGPRRRLYWLTGAGAAEARRICDQARDRQPARPQPRLEPSSAPVVP